MQGPVLVKIFLTKWESLLVLTPSVVFGSSWSSSSVTLAWSDFEDSWVSDLLRPAQPRPPCA